MRKCLGPHHSGKKFREINSNIETSFVCITLGKEAKLSVLRFLICKMAILTGSPMVVLGFISVSLLYPEMTHG